MQMVSKQKNNSYHRQN